MTGGKGDKLGITVVTGNSKETVVPRHSPLGYDSSAYGQDKEGSSRYDDDAGRYEHPHLTADKSC